MDWSAVDSDEPMEWEEIPLPPQVSTPGTSFSSPPVANPEATPRPTMLGDLRKLCAERKTKRSMYDKIMCINCRSNGNQF
ncbi:hypothetical protein HNY73_017569 [Argiope bruennichi]|uniref:Uncharacterized protein n=1 Tax=Argiope bruennichi TaxID=94029 RepID=A0A8T0EB40_ARGBR|nr:hypothetical protein HNY73_017569 [Argiope bruennichi]